MSDTIVVSFANQKGGVGKSTLTVLLASYLYYELGVSVAILDCDSPQNSPGKERKRELLMVKETPHLQEMSAEQYQRTGLRPYTIVETPLQDGLKVLDSILSGDNNYSILFLDLPGTMNNQNVIQLVANCHYVFCPMAADKVDIESTLAFCQYLYARIVTTSAGNIKQVKTLWTKVDGRERNNLYTVYDDFMESIGVSAMKTSIPSSVRFKKELSTEPGLKHFRCTLFPPDPSLLKGSNIPELAEEFLETIGLKHGKR